MKKNVILFLLVFVSIAAFGQQDKSFKFAIELDGKLKKADANTYFDSPIGVARFGSFAEFRLTNHFSGKLKIGLNNTYLHQDAIDYESGDNIPEMTKIVQSLDIGLEPVFYFLSTELSRKVNLFVALPIMFETKSIGDKKYIFRTKFTIVPSLGFRYDFTKHWGIEASSGLGLRKYGKYKYSMKSSEMEYGLSVGVRYSF
jgi:hypothetical protein